VVHRKYRRAEQAKVVLFTVYAVALSLSTYGAIVDLIFNVTSAVDIQPMPLLGILRYLLCKILLRSNDFAFQFERKVTSCFFCCTCFKTTTTGTVLVLPRRIFRHDSLFLTPVISIQPKKLPVSGRARAEESYTNRSYRG
jgi:hypothetical protein